MNHLDGGFVYHIPWYGEALVATVVIIDVGSLAAVGFVVERDVMRVCNVGVATKEESGDDGGFVFVGITDGADATNGAD